MPHFTTLPSHTTYLLRHTSRLISALHASARTADIYPAFYLLLLYTNATSALLLLYFAHGVGP